MRNCFFMVIILFLSFSGCSKSSDNILQEISGVWRAKNDGTMVIINYDNKNIKLVIGEHLVATTLGSIDNTNKIVNIITPDSEIWTLKQVWDKERKNFNLFFTLHGGEQYELSFIRKVSVEDLDRIAIIEKNVISQKNLAEENAEKIQTRFGQLEIKNISDYEKGIFLSSKIIFKKEHCYLDIIKIFQIQNNDVALIRNSAGGSGTIDNFFFITLSQNTPPILSDMFMAQGNEINPAQDESKIIIDLGFIDGSHGILTYQDGKISIKESVPNVDKEQANEADCNYLYSNIYVPYVKKKACNENPEEVGGMSTERAYNVMSNDHRLKLDELQKISKESCQTSKIVKYSEFKKKICANKNF